MIGTGIVQLTVILLLTLSCQTVTVKPGGGKYKYSSTPQYQASQHFFFWGLVGEKYIDVSSICGGRAIKQMQTQATFANQFLFWITLGIYSPKTTRVWCGKSMARLDEKTRANFLDKETGGGSRLHGNDGGNGR